MLNLKYVGTCNEHGYPVPDFYGHEYHLFRDEAGREYVFPARQPVSFSEGWCISPSAPSNPDRACTCGSGESWVTCPGWFHGGEYTTDYCG